MQANNNIASCDAQFLSLTKAEASADVEAWFKANPRGGTLRDCLDDLAGVSPTRYPGLVANLDKLSQFRVALEFHRRNAKLLGLTLTDADLYSMAHGDWAAC